MWDSAYVMPERAGDFETTHGAIADNTGNYCRHLIFRPDHLALRTFLGLYPHRQQESKLGTKMSVDDASVVLKCQIGDGKVGNMQHPPLPVTDWRHGRSHHTAW